MNKDILSKILIHSKYANYLEDKGRRETWNETVDRSVAMHVRKFPEYEEEINSAFKHVRNKEIMPSMRSIQFAGRPIERNESRQYNCAYLPMDSVEAFREVMFLLMGGTGVGYSVQHRHTDKLPVVKEIKGHQKFLIEDSIIGWSDAVDALIKGHLKTGIIPEFDYSEIRPKGSPLKTTGGKAPGPDKLRGSLNNISELLNGTDAGESLWPHDVHDICCYIASAVMSGGIRRAAMICLFDKEAFFMKKCKSGNWFEDNPQRAYANNSAVFDRNEMQENEFKNFWNDTKENGTGEPGVYLTNDKDIGGNPCMEISLRPMQFCNLVTVDSSKIKDEEHALELVSAASFIGTLQATYTDFHYLRHEWKETTEEDALVGVSFTGIASGNLEDIDLTALGERAKTVNEYWATEWGINPAARITTVKPEGSTSLVCGTSSGIHAWHDKYYIRRKQLPKNDALAKYLRIKMPELIETHHSDDQSDVIAIPIKAPEGAITRDESPMDLLERIKRFNVEWVQAGHRSGANFNNVSAT